MTSATDSVTSPFNRASPAESDSFDVQRDRIVGSFRQAHALMIGGSNPPLAIGRQSRALLRLVGAVSPGSNPGCSFPTATVAQSGRARTSFAREIIRPLRSRQTWPPVIDSEAHIASRKLRQQPGIHRWFDFTLSSHAHISG